MSQSFTLEGYRIDAAHKPEVAPEGPRRVWSRKVAFDIVAFFEVSAVIAGGFLPNLLYVAAGAITMSWPAVAQSALLAALIYRMLLQTAGAYDHRSSADVMGRPAHMALALICSVVVAVSLGAPNQLDLTNTAIWFVLWTAASYAAIILVRTIASDMLAVFAAQGRFDERIAVYGAGHIARRVHDHLSNPDLGLHFVGVYDSRGTPDRVNPEGLSVAGGLDDLVLACREGRVDRVVIALPQIAERRVNDIARKFEDLSVCLHIVTHLSSDYCHPTRGHTVSQLGPVGLIDLKTKRHADWAPIVKRLEDIVIGGLAALAVLPMFPLIALAIKLESKGPVFFIQRRRGLRGDVINVVKFRTMSVMEDGSEVKQAVDKDPRVTRVGRILRRTSLDELPQIFNVLKGDMSLVGPRPHALSHDRMFEETVETYANRHQMKPGVTGLAQVRGCRGETRTQKAIEDRVRFDLEYIRNWSLGLDLKIIAMTVVTVLVGTNAV